MTWALMLRRSFRARHGRSVFSALSVALGVMVFVAVSIGARNLSDALAAERSPIDAQLVQLAPVGVFDATAPAETAGPLADLPGVVTVQTALQTSAQLSRADAAATDPRPTTLVSADWPGRSLDDGVLVVPASIAEELNAQVGDRVRVQTPTGTHEGLVGEIVTEQDRLSTFAVQANRTTVEDWSNQRGRISSAFVVLQPGIDQDDWIAEHGDSLGSLAPLSSGTFVSSRAEEFFRQVEDTIAPVAGAALFVAGYLIFLTLSRAVQEQARTHATMRVVGASGSQIGVLVIIEAAVIAVAGTIVGLALGVASGGVVAEAMRQIFGLDVLSTNTTAPMDIVATGTALGICVPLAAAALPAVRAARTPPAISLQPTQHTIPPRSRILRAVAGAALIGGGLMALATVPASWTSIATLATLAGAATLLPVLAQPVAQAMANLLGRIAPGAGELAAQDLARRPGHSAATAALLAVTLAIVVLVGTITASTRPGFTRVLDAHYGNDIRAEIGDHPPLTANQIDQVRALPSVADATPQTFGRVRVHTNQAGVHPLQVIDPTSYFRMADLAWTSTTDPETAVEKLAAGNHVALARPIADAANVVAGDQITLATPQGPATFAVAGIYHGLSYGETASVITNTADARRHFGLQGATTLLIDRAPTDSSIQADLAAAGLPELFIIPNHVIYDQIYAQFEGLTGLITVILIITATVGILGLANTLIIDTLERRRDIGIIRAIGAAPQDITRYILARSLVLTTTAGIGATALGLLLGAATIIPRDTNLNIEATYHFPTTATIAVLTTALLLGLTASIHPARQATNIEPHTAIHQ